MSSDNVQVVVEKEGKNAIANPTVNTMNNTNDATSDDNDTNSVVNAIVAEVENDEKLDEDITNTENDDEDEEEMNISVFSATSEYTDDDDDISGGSSDDTILETESEGEEDDVIKKKTTAGEASAQDKKDDNNNVIVEGLDVVVTDVTESVVEPNTIIINKEGEKTGEEEKVVVIKKQRRKRRKTDSSSNKGGRPQKHNKNNNQQAIKFPPLTSPGLLLNSNGIVTTPSYIFQEALDNAGYTEAYRTNSKNYLHANSTIKKEVGDMFDSNVVFCNLIHMEEDLTKKGVYEDDNYEEFVAALMQCSKPPTSDNDDTYYKDPIKRVNFEEMIPMTLITNYPDSYKEELQTYTYKVIEREEIIKLNVSIKEANKAAAATATKKKISTLEEAKQAATPEKQKPVPPIPETPVLPECSRSTSENNNTHTQQHDPNNSLSYRYTAHLDPACFYPTTRYYNLLTNNIADPHFVGPNAPGITASGSNVAQHAYTINPTTGLAPSPNSTKELATATPLMTPSSSATVNVPIKNLPLFSNKKLPKATTPNAPKCTKSIVQLRKIMEQNPKTDPIVAKMKHAIIIAAMDLARQEEQKTLGITTINAANIIQHPFEGADGEIYPDVARAFAAYSDLKPCKRCKSNKQGSFHCRMRRKHDGADHDGGFSYSILQEVKESDVSISL